MYRGYRDNTPPPSSFGFWKLWGPGPLQIYPEALPGTGGWKVSGSKIRFRTLDLLENGHGSNYIITTNPLLSVTGTQFAKVLKVGHISNPQPLTRPLDPVDQAHKFPWIKTLKCGSAGDHSGHWLLNLVFEDWKFGFETKISCLRISLSPHQRWAEWEDWLVGLFGREIWGCKQSQDFWVRGRAEAGLEFLDHKQIKSNLKQSKQKGRHRGEGLTLLIPTMKKRKA